MDELKYMLQIMQGDLEGIKENMVRGQYRSQEAYFQVLGECRMLLKMIAEAEKLIAKREENDGFDDDSDD